MKIASMGQESQEIEAYLSCWAACRGWIFQTERAVSGGRYDVVLAGPMAGKAAPTCQTPAYWLAKCRLGRFSPTEPAKAR